MKGSAATETTEEILGFLMDVYDGYPDGSWVFLAKGRDGKPTAFREFQVGNDLGSALAEFLATAHTEMYDLFFCPLAYSQPERKEKYAIGSPYLFADWDDAQPPTGSRLEPTIVWQTSPGHHQGLYKLPAFLATEELKPMNRLLTRIVHADKGAGLMTQLLRVPGSYNMKKKYGGPQPVLLRRKSDRLFDPGLLKSRAAGILASVWEKVPDDVKHQYLVVRAGVNDDRSALLYREHIHFLGLGLSQDEVFWIAKESPYNKFRDDGRPDEDARLREGIARAANAIFGLTPESERDEIDAHIQRLAELENGEKIDYATREVFPRVKRLNEVDRELYAKKLKAELNVPIGVIRRQVLPEATPGTQLEPVPDETLEQGRRLAETLGPRPLDEVAKVVRDGLGVVGEDKNIKLLYLVLTTRILDKPVSAVMKGVSSAGKSFTVDRTLQLFPGQAYIARTGLSPHALAYSEEDYRHRTLIVYEADGLGEEAAHFLRTLLSEGHIMYETVEKTPRGLRPRVIRKDGPTNCVMTTTRVSLHPENETRLLSLSVDDSPEQTRAIMMCSAQPARMPDLSPWKAMQHWLAGQSTAVEIPFAGALAQATSDCHVRLRRDFNVVLSLTKAHALLCQADRDRNARGELVATLDDYEAVRELVEPVISAGVDSAVKPRVREVVDLVRRLDAERYGGRKGDASEPEGEISVTRVAGELDIDKSTASRRIREAMHLGYIINTEAGKRGVPAKLKPGDSLPSDSSVLPSKDQIVRMLRRG